jgi:sugar phosphate isomerase/epimerase
MIFSMSNISWLPHERLQAYDMMASFGLTGLEIAPALFFHDADDPFVPNVQRIRSALAEIKRHGLTLVSMQSLLFGVDGAALFGDIEQRVRLEAGMVRAINLAERLEIPNLVFGSPKQRRVPKGMGPETAIDIAIETFRRLGDRAAAAGTTIAIEANPREYGTNFLNRLRSAVSFVGRVEHPQILLNLDLGAMRMNGEYEKAQILIPPIVKILNHVHVSEPNLEPAPEDPSALAPVLSTLMMEGYGKAVSIEMKRAETGLEAVAKSLSALGDAMAQGAIA